MCVCVPCANTFRSGWNYSKATTPAASAGGDHLGSDGDQFQGPVGFDSVCFGDVRARVVEGRD